MFLISKEADGLKGYHDVFAQAAESLNGQIIFAKAGMKTEDHTKIAKTFKVTDDMMPALRIIDPGNKRKYFWEGDVQNMTQSDIEKFINEFKSGALTPNYQS